MPEGAWRVLPCHRREKSIDVYYTRTRPAGDGRCGEDSGSFPIATLGRTRRRRARPSSSSARCDGWRPGRGGLPALAEAGRQGRRLVAAQHGHRDAGTRQTAPGRSAGRAGTRLLMRRGRGRPLGRGQAPDRRERAARTVAARHAQDEPQDAAAAVHQNTPKIAIATSARRPATTASRQIRAFNGAPSPRSFVRNGFRSDTRSSLSDEGPVRRRAQTSR